MKLITVNFLTIRSFCMLIFYVITSIWEAAALANAAGIIGNSSPGSMSVSSNGKFVRAIYMIFMRLSIFFRDAFFKTLLSHPKWWTFKHTLALSTSSTK